MRRMLLVADVLALVTTFLVVELVFGPGSGADNRFGSVGEYALLLAMVPAWIVMAKFYGLYEEDEERTHHPTSDEITRVFDLLMLANKVSGSFTK